jgi:hypothetical protein
MPPEILALIDKPLSLVAVLFVGALAGMVVEQVVSKRRREAWKRKNAERWQQNKRTGEFGGNVTKGQEPAEQRCRDAADQLRTVMAAEFTVQPLLNNGEARLFRELDRMVIGRNPGWQVMAQVCVGEILRSKDAKAYSCINSKRVDLLLMDEACQARHAIEYQGSGHHVPGSAAAARDAVKKEALRKAGIGYHEVIAGHTTPAELKRLIEKLVPPLQAGDKAA